MIRAKTFQPTKAGSLDERRAKAKLPDGKAKGRRLLVRGKRNLLMSDKRGKGDDVEPDHPSGEEEEGEENDDDEEAGDEGDGEEEEEAEEEAGDEEEEEKMEKEEGDEGNDMENHDGTKDVVTERNALEDENEHATKE